MGKKMKEQIVHRDEEEVMAQRVDHLESMARSHMKNELEH
jgi:hypothetical protein